MNELYPGFSIDYQNVHWGENKIEKKYMNAFFVYAVRYIFTFTPSYTEQMQIKCTFSVHL
jgi:hypothetical protein